MSVFIYLTDALHVSQIWPMSNDTFINVLPNQPALLQYTGYFHLIVMLNSTHLELIGQGQSHKEIVKCSML